MNINRLLQFIGTVFALLLIAAGNSSYATDASQLRIYINPGHGSWGPNDRPMATIPYPNLSSTGRPDTCGFYESNTNLWKAQKLRQCLINAGMLPQNVVMSRNYNGPYPYVAEAADAEIYNKPLSEICEEADAGNFDMFFSIHSNSATDGALTNYSLYLYRGTDDAESVAGSKAMAQAIWPHASVKANELDYASHYTASTNNIRGDISFYGSSSTRYGSKGNYTGYLGVLKHSVPGFLSEGYFHSYQPARHRALNKDYCYQEGVRYFRGIASYFGLPAESTGYIMGAVKDQAQSVNNSLYTYQSGSRAGDEYLPLMGAVVSLYKDGNLVADYTTDNKYNGIFVFENLQPGTYTLKTTANGYADKTETVTVTANATASPLLYLTADTGADSMEMVNDGGTNYASQIQGEVIYSAQQGDFTALLTSDSGTPRIYIVNNSTKEVQHTMRLSYGNKTISKLSAIAFTSDFRLIGCGATTTQAAGSAKLQFYKWDTYDSAPVEWISSTSSGNYSNATVGETFAINGDSRNCRIVYPAVTTGSSTETRFVSIYMINGSQQAATYTLTPSPAITKNSVGNHMHLRPLENGDFILDGDNIRPMQLSISDTNRGTTTIVATGGNNINAASSCGDYFSVDSDAMMVMPQRDNSGSNTGIIVYKANNGIAAPTVVSSSSTTLSAATASYQAAHAATAIGNAPVLYLVKDKTIVKFERQATTPVDPATAFRIYINPGHGGFGPNDRPMATIPYPNLASTGRPDTCGFYESNTNLWKAFELNLALRRMGVQRENIVMSRVTNGPFPYVSADSTYNKHVSVLAAEIEQGNFDMWISIHSNAAGHYDASTNQFVDEGQYANYPLILYNGTNEQDYVPGSKAIANAIWRRHWITETISPMSQYGLDDPYVAGEWSWYPSAEIDENTNKYSGKTYRSYLGISKNGVKGCLIEGFCHTYGPDRHRALNEDYCRQMGVRIARGIGDYFGFAQETTGYIMGTVKDKKSSVNNSLYRYMSNSVDAYLPINGATVSLYSGETLVDTYSTDNNYNGIFVFSNLAPGRYRLVTSYTGYDDDEQIVDVTANETTYPLVYLNNDDTTPKGIFAYNLISTRNQVDGSYTFTFTPNANTKRASLIFYDAATGVQVGDAFPINNAEEGVITSVTLTQEQLPGSGGQTLNWAVSLTGKPITEITTLNDPDNFSFNRIGNIVDNSPESDYFGRFYLINRIASGNSDNGLWAYNQDWSKINSTVIRNSYTDSNPFRLATDQNGKIYIANFADGATSGVYTVDPATLAAPTPFFVGTHASDGTITAGNGDVICTSTASVFITGTGVNTHMYCHFEDGTKDIAQYNIGNSDGSIVSSWSTAPSRSWGIGSMLASLHAAVIGETDNGIWIVQNRGAGQNTSTVPSLMYVANDGTIKYNSANDNAFTTACTGTQYAAGALSADGTELVVNQPDGKLKFFSISYNNNVPTLTYKYDYAAGAGNQVTQINYDWGGNLFVSGSKLAILALPQSDNTHVTPAKKALTVVKDNETHYTLAQLVVDGTPGSRYALDGEYTCVYIDKSSQVLYCKDNNLAANKSEAAGRVNYARAHALMTDDYDQSNWIAVTLPRALYTYEYEDYQGHLISGIHGLYTDGLNPALTASEMPSAGEVAEYSPNVYIPCNFITANLALENYFFVRPKPQEYAIITWAVYDSATQGFYVTESTASQNVENFTGGVIADFSLIPGDADPTEFFTNNEAYRFHAIIRQLPGNSAPRVTKAIVTGANTDAVSDSFTVYPLEMSRDGIITHILNTDENAQRNIIATKYFTPAGIELPQAPDSGIYIEVNIYDDGSRDSRKLMR